MPDPDQQQAEKIKRLEKFSFRMRRDMGKFEPEKGPARIKKAVRYVKDKIGEGGGNATRRVGKGVKAVEKADQYAQGKAAKLRKSVGKKLGI